VGFSFLIMLREGLEIALVVAIILAYLKRLERRNEFTAVWAGAGAGVAVALGAGTAVFVVLGELEGTAEQVTEGLIAFGAAAVLSWMIFWMARQARFIKGTLQKKVDAALKTGSFFSLATIAFVAVVREGMEAALFMLSSTVGQSSFDAAVGGGAGLAVACGIGYAVYAGSRWVNLRLFFRVTGAVVVLFAAGLLATGVHEFQEAGFLATTNEHLWNLSQIAILNPDSSTLGEFLHGLFGWSAAPSSEMVLGYGLYLVPVMIAFLIATRTVPAARPRPAEVRAPAA
jgi:high-affinity iron transporter